MRVAGTTGGCMLQSRLLVLFYVIGNTNYTLILEIMTIYEILSFNKELLQRLFNAGIRTSDCLYVDLFDDYTRMRAAGEKTTYIVAVLSDKYA